MLEEFSALVGRHLRRITRPDALAASFSRWAPAAEATAVFTDRLEKGGGEILDIIKVPPNPDFARFLQRARSDG